VARWRSWARWLYLRRSDGTYRLLPKVALRRLHDGTAALQPELADRDGYLRYADVGVTLTNGVPTRPLKLSFHSVPLTADGKIHPDYMADQLFLVGSRWPRLAPETDAGESVSRLADRRRLAHLRWEPAAAERARLLALVEARLAKADGQAAERAQALYAAPLAQRRRLARAEGTADHTWGVLVSDPAVEVRATLAANPAVDTEILHALSDDEAPEVRRSVAANGAFQNWALPVLIEDPQEDVRAAAARNPRLEVKIAEQLSWNDPSELVRAAAQKRLEGDPRYLARLAATSAISVSRLAHLARHRDWRIRLAVAHNPKTSIPVLRRLAGDDDNPVRIEAIKRIAKYGPEVSRRQLKSGFARIRRKKPARPPAPRLRVVKRPEK
jgi:hypothetical protein